jgi:hypothetical protein
MHGVYVCMFSNHVYVNVACLAPELAMRVPLLNHSIAISSVAYAHAVGLVSDACGAEL